MTEGNGNAWENWERNTEESHEYADFILKELGSITNTNSVYNQAQDSNVQAVYNEIFEAEIEYKKPESPTPENLPKLQQAISNDLCTEENSNPTDSNTNSVPLEAPEDKPDSPEDKPDFPKDKPDSPEDKPDSPEDKHDSREEKPADPIHVDSSVSEKGKTTVNRKRKYQKRKSITAKRRKPTKAGSNGRKNSLTTRNPIPKVAKEEPCPAPLFSNTDSSDDEVTIPESLIEDKSSPNEIESAKSNPSNKGKATRKRRSPESDSQKSVEIGFVRRSSRQSVPPTEVYQSFRLSPKRKPVPKKDVSTKNAPLAIEIKPEVQESLPDEDRPIKTSEEESTFDTNCPPPPFVCVTDTDSESSDPASPNPPRMTQRIANKTQNEAPKENVRRSGRASKRPAKYSQGSSTSAEVDPEAVTSVPETKKTVWKSVVIESTAETNEIDWKERYDELKKKFDEQAKELENEKLKNLKLEVNHLRERNELQAKVIETQDRLLKKRISF